MFIIGLFGVFLQKYSPQFIKDMTSLIGNWKYWLLVIGAFLLIIFGWFIFDRYRKMKEFKELYETKSKSKFRKNIARIETLALTLGPEYEDKVIEKEEEYGLDR